MKYPVGAIPHKDQKEFLRKCAQTPGTIFWIIIRKTYGKRYFCPVKAWTTNKTKYSEETNILKDFNYHYYNTPDRVFREGWLEGDLHNQYFFFENFWFAFACMQQAKLEKSND